MNSPILNCLNRTNGRSPRAKELQFTVIRTTLLALTALVDNRNSLQTNAFDEEWQIVGTIVDTL